MASDAATMSIADYARARGVTPQAIWLAEKEGRLRTVGGRVAPAEADATWYRRHQQRQDGRRSGAETEARREQALMTRTIAHVQMTRRDAERLRARLVERDKGQGMIGALVTALRERLPGVGADAVDAALAAAAIEAIAHDLGDLQAEALKVTRTE